MKTSINTIDKTPAALILLAAGSSTRMGNSGKKEFLQMNGGAVLSVAAAAFLQTSLFSTIAVAYPKGELAATKTAFFSLPKTAELAAKLKVIFVQGGKSRQQSVLRALESIKSKSEFQPKTVLIHDGARPFLSSALVRRTLKAAQKYGAAVGALEPVETQKEINSRKTIVRHLQRKNLASVQTPQGFDFEKILLYHRAAKKDGRACTDDTEIWDNYAATKTHIIPGETENVKITYPSDLIKIKLKSKIKFKGKSGKAALPTSTDTSFRIGLGYDLHQLVKGRRLFLGGVVIPFEKGELGHSDGDALLHAITDALLGAAALGDIGSYFPDTDKKYKNADSKKLLAAAWADVKRAGWSLVNLDCVVKLQKPKFLPYRPRVIESIAKVLGVEKSRVFVKAKTAEGLGSVGNSEAVECEVVCILIR